MCLACQAPCANFFKAPYFVSTPRPECPCASFRGTHRGGVAESHATGRVLGPWPRGRDEPPPAAWRHEAGGNVAEHVEQVQARRIAPLARDCAAAFRDSREAGRVLRQAARDCGRATRSSSRGERRASPPAGPKRRLRILRWAIVTNAIRSADTATGRPSMRARSLSSMSRNSMISASSRSASTADSPPFRKLMTLPFASSSPLLPPPDAKGWGFLLTASPRVHG